MFVGALVSDTDHFSIFLTVAEQGILGDFFNISHAVTGQILRNLAK